MLSKAITVKQLIRHLSEFDQEAIVLFEPILGDPYKPYNTISISEKEVKKIDSIAEECYDDADNKDNPNPIINAIILYSKED